MFTRPGRNICRRRQGASLVVVDALDKAGNLAQAGLERRRETLASGHDLKPATPTPYQQRLEYAMTPDRFHEIGGRTMVTFAVDGVDGSHIEMANRRAK